MSIEDLRAWVEALRQREAARGEPMFLGIPEAWFEAPGPKYRCTGDHVSRYVLKSEGLGRDACLECFGPLVLTFPKDVDGPRQALD